jgi:putative thiamine transport system substrate-binding protein
MTLSRVLLLISLLVSPAYAANPDPADWDEVLRAARGQTVYFDAWAGDPQINSYIAWTASQLRTRYGVELTHVKLSDTAEAVSRVLAEKLADNVDQGTVDLLWVNGENFATMKQNALLFGPWAEQLPNFALVDADLHPEMREDFTIPVEGYEAPWTRAQLVFYYDSALVDSPPQNMKELLQWAKTNPGQFTYPRPPVFLGSTFLKQALLELVDDRNALYRPVVETEFAAITAPLWAFLDALHPVLLRGGRSFPNGGTELRRMMGDGEISLAISFSPSEANTGIAAGELPPTVRTYVPKDVSIGNVSFLAIPFNAQAKAGAMVAANFLLSAEAQAHAYDPAVMGSATVLSMARLEPGERARFESITLGPATLAPEALGLTLREPHPDWMDALERAWIERYGAR